MTLIGLLEQLSKLRLKTDAKALLKKQLPEIIEYVSRIKRLKTEGVKPTFHTSTGSVSLRGDAIKRDRRLRLNGKYFNISTKQKNYFIVDKIL